ncbi:1-deoxy-D-xylulose-5-phosphate synthase N-terminal domain-containing protein [Dactylosporangium sp. AC04546]|uniref:transketolase n=1 Tax=Dactylosporangium sp. AC04546 TaxID=2862460 RepID=UPI001EE0BECC|nr:1-deoxy-D-xylulose-5-phosphate synthase N-terminal domain-containing protein [Dactylosporangium sp. AC04546]WVK88795.1 1-deoxy-D-xylulose-5-phosphate synthase N-terminal domain-containing protein [Dactylosporangium sp. AC04546]
MDLKPESPVESSTELAELADRIRLRAVRMVAMHGLGYLGQALSSAEILATVYRRVYRPDADRIVISPGHYVIGAFAAAAESGLLDPAALATYGHDGSRLEAIGTERSPSVDLTCGSLGQGLSAAVGFALSDRLRGRADARTVVLVSDGELEEGQVWEAAMFAGHHRLDRLVALVDANNSQVDGPVAEITTIEPIADKWRAFGWHAQDVDGHDTGALAAAVDAALEADRPAVVIARTSTTTGLDCLPDNTDGHFVKLPPELAERATAELEARLA